MTHVKGLQPNSFTFLSAAFRNLINQIFEAIKKHSFEGGRSVGQISVKISSNPLIPDQFFFQNFFQPAPRGGRRESPGII